MRFETLFEGIDWRHATDSDQNVARHHISDVTISPETGCENALFVAVRTGLSNTRYQMQVAYARGCRLFLCDHDAAPGAGATVVIVKEPERLLGPLAARVYGYPARSMSVIGITGSAGKSAVALLAARVLERAGYRVATLGSDGLSLNGNTVPPGAIVPDAAQVQRSLWQMKRAGTQIAILELSSYQLSHFAANGIDFLGTVLTNFLPRHIGNGEHESVAEYLEAKLRLLQSPAAFSILPGDMEVSAQASAIRLGRGGDLEVTDVCEFHPYHAPPGMSFSILEKEQKTEITLPVVGDIAVENAACVFALCRALGICAQEIAQTLSHAVLPGRMSLVASFNGALVYRDNAFLPEDLARTLQALRPFAKGRLAVLLGSVGGRAAFRRAPLARAAQQYADFAYFTADDPDFEAPERICMEMLQACFEPERVCILPDRKAAIRRAVQELRPGDVLLITGKAYPQAQLIGGVEYPFDDAAVVREILAQI